ncbi:hypothetical protein AVEN_195182-1 [Araneus ventricosus]|uniref:Uncharacterized protein n=1 Tax=Araneus ventricosus TaxID=182803 RepID=A0A4Y2JDI6_ARAVE|nr:hypothetical protein AVEN_195182-1 [Araneus ventricosus]
MGNQRKSCHQQQKYSGSVLRVTVNFASHSDQPQETGRFQKADQRCRLCNRKRESENIGRTSLVESSANAAHAGELAWGLGEGTLTEVVRVRC